MPPTSSSCRSRRSSTDRSGDDDGAAPEVVPERRGSAWSPSSTSPGGSAWCATTTAGLPVPLRGHRRRHQAHRRRGPGWCSRWPPGTAAATRPGRVTTVAAARRRLSSGRPVRLGSLGSLGRRLPVGGGRGLADLDEGEADLGQGVFERRLGFAQPSGQTLDQGWPWRRRPGGPGRVGVVVGDRWMAASSNSP